MSGRERALEEREEALRDRVRGLPEEGRRVYFRRLQQQVRDPDTYAVLNYLAPTGLHHFYLGRWGRGALNLGVFTLGFVLLLAGLPAAGGLVILAVLAVELPQLFRSQTIVAEHNLALQERLLQEADGKRSPDPVHPSYF